MSALAEALLAAQRAALAAMQRAYLAGSIEDMTGLIETMDRIGCTDSVDQAQYLAALETLHTLGVQPPTVTNAPPKESKPASEAQWKLIRRLADERGTVAPDGPLTVEQASKVIEELRAARVAS